LKASELLSQTRDLRINRSRTEAQLVFYDASILHFRVDRFSRWVQASPGKAQEIRAELLEFSLSRRGLELTWQSGGTTRIVRGSFRIRVEEA
jgi:hypothetical protein